ncbi:alpha/beta hydrolase-fold protein [Streptantibioticus parmotrematis]|uniref:alpha/beta hydrolase n=1 Tax=Streptantibioticus parmotrematis TaxID=2873249 RepID=UPI0034017C2A
MGLTSEMFFAGLVIAALVASALALWLWPRVARASVPSWLGRIGLLVAVQVTVLGVLLVAVNNSFGFYSSWQDLLGAPVGKQVMDASDAKGGRPSGIKVEGVIQAGLKGGKEQAGEVESVHFQGLASGLSSDGYVYLPPQYFQKAHQADRFPVVVALTGYPGVASNLITGLKVPRTVSDDIAAKRIRPVIYVMVRPTVVPGRDTNCTDVPGGPQALTFFNQDLPYAVASQFRTTDGPGSWAAVGDSTGGYCALKFAMTNPARYGVAAGLSADYGAAQDSQTGDLYAGNAQYKHEQDLNWRMAHMPPAPVSLLVSSSKKGEGNYKETLQLAADAKWPTKVTKLIRDEGGHNFKTWRAEYPDVIRWIDQQLPHTPNAAPGANSPSGQPHS